MAEHASALLRSCLQEPIPHIAEAARLLDEATSAHLRGDVVRARELLQQADMPEIRSWSQALWARKPATAHDMPARDGDRPVRPADRMPPLPIQRQLHDRDGFHCRYCGIPVIRKQVRQRFRQLYPDLRIWGFRRTEQHAAFQAMWAQYDHVVPMWAGGSNDPANIVVCCAPCYHGRMGDTLEQAGLLNPLDRPPVQSAWDGLERLLQAGDAKRPSPSSA